MLGLSTPIAKPKTVVFAVTGPEADQHLTEGVSTISDTGLKSTLEHGITQYTIPHNRGRPVPSGANRVESTQ